MSRTSSAASSAADPISRRTSASTPHQSRTSRTPADTPADTPAEALRELAAGNRRFVEGMAIAPNRTMARIKDVEPKQAPFAAVLACAD